MVVQFILLYIFNVEDGKYSVSCSLEQLNSGLFYSEVLDWDETIWDFSDLDFENGKMPTLK